jgi:hypothetical protein
MFVVLLGPCVLLLLHYFTQVDHGSTVGLQCLLTEVIGALINSLAILSSKTVLVLMPMVE